MSVPQQATFSSVVDLSVGSAPDRFIGPVSPERGGRTYGGQLLAQAVQAAYLTVDDDRQINSLHALFLRPGAVDETTDWQVERVREGRSFSTRETSGFQGGKEIFRLMASFHVPEDGLEFEPPTDFDIASVPPPEEVETTYLDFCQAHPDLAASDWFGQDRPIEIRYIDPPDPIGGPPLLDPQQTWIRLLGTLTDDPGLHAAGLAYMADGTLIDHVLLPHGFRWSDARLTGASLDHAMWFRRSVRVDQWLLYDQRVESTGGGRGLATGRFYTSTGELVATCTQEGLIRWQD
ncbi:MAG: acyl-CoA thioesterase [Acidimicrobiales bacterium]